MCLIDPENESTFAPTFGSEMFWLWTQFDKEQFPSCPIKGNIRLVLLTWNDKCDEDEDVITFRCGMTRVVKQEILQTATMKRNKFVNSKSKTMKVQRLEALAETTTPAYSITHGYREITPTQDNVVATSRAEPPRESVLTTAPPTVHEQFSLLTPTGKQQPGLAVDTDITKNLAGKGVVDDDENNMPSALNLVANTELGGEGEVDDGENTMPSASNIVADKDFAGEGAVDDGEETIPSDSNIAADIDLAGEEAVGNAENTMPSASINIADKDLAGEGVRSG